MTPHARTRLFWRLQIGGWLLLVPVTTGAAMFTFDQLGNIVLTGVVRQLLAFGLTLGLWRFYRRWPAATFKLAPHVGQIALACIAANVIDAALIEGIRVMLHYPPPPPTIQRGALIARLALYLAWSAVYFLIRHELETRERELRLAQAETAAREAEVAMLRAQVNPHFMFNALTSILGVCDDDPRAVRAITEALADYLRASLLQPSHHAPLGEEVDAIAGYLRVEQARFEKKLVTTFAIEGDAREALAPTALLLPLVENAVKYGLRTSPWPLRVTISAAVRAGRLTVAVENSGRWLDPQTEASDSTRIGLANLRRRLVLLHGDDATLEISHDAQSVRVVVTLPVATSVLTAEQHA